MSWGVGYTRSGLRVYAPESKTTGDESSRRFTRHSQKDAGSVVNTMRASLTTLRNPLMSRVVSTDPVATSTHPSRKAG